MRIGDILMVSKQCKHFQLQIERFTLLADYYSVKHKD